MQLIQPAVPASSLCFWDENLLYSRQGVRLSYKDKDGTVSALLK